MRQIEIDDEVFAYLQNQAIAFVEQPNDTLRRLLAINNSEKVSIESRMVSDDRIPTTVDYSRSTISRRDLLDRTLMRSESFRKKKGPRTDLKLLVDAELLSEGQILYMHDYRGKKIEGKQASVSNGKLMYDEQLYSMSQLAKEFLVEAGYKSTHVRGPKFWKTEEGISVQSLWTRYKAHNF